MAELTLTVDAGSLPAGFCPTTLQQMLVGFAAQMSVTFPTTFSGITVSATQPEDITQAWLQLDSLGRPVRLYYFSNGAWLSRHPIESGMVMIWTGTLPDFTTFDGGDADALSAISGPMWEEVTALRAKYPIGVGTLPSATVLAVGDTGGEEKHVLTNAEGAMNDSHTHVTSQFETDIGDDANDQWFPLGTLGDTPTSEEAITARRNESGGALQEGPLSDQSGKYGITLTTREKFSTLSGGNRVFTGHNNLPPFVAVYFLRRTSRQFYSVT